MRIALLANAENIHTRRWAKWLAAQDGCTVAVFTDTSARNLDPRVEQITPRYSRLEELRLFALGADEFTHNRHKHEPYGKALRAWQPDVVHAMEALGYGPILPHVPEWPRVLTPWGSDVLVRAEESEEARQLVTDAMQSADVITGNAPGLEGDLAARFAVPRDRMQFFSWGVDTNVFRLRPSPSKRELRGRLNLPAERRIVLSSRRPLDALGRDDILNGWREAGPEAEEHDARLVLLRAGVTDDEWVEAVDRASKVHRVILALEAETPAKMADYITAADAFISAPHTDFLASTVLEGMACGALPLLAPLPAYRAVIADVGCGDGLTALFAKGHEPGELAEIIKRWMSMSESEITAITERNAQIIGSKFAWRDCAPRMLQVYAEAIERFRVKEPQRHG